MRTRNSHYVVRLVELKEKINRVFKELRKAGLIAKQNFLCCSNCASYAITQEAEKMMLANKEVKGCVYYHHQDSRSFEERGKLALRYGNMSSEKFGTIGWDTRTVGNFLAGILRQNGIVYEWDENPDTVIYVDSNETYQKGAEEKRQKEELSELGIPY